MQRLWFVILLCWSITLLAACSDDNNKPTPPNNPPTVVQLSAYGDVVQAIAPPVFGAATASLSAGFDGVAVDTGYEFWASGDFPVLGKVFGAEQVMSLYYNIARLDEQVTVLNIALAHANTTFDTIVDGEPMTVQTVVQDLSTPIEVPAECQEVLGISQVELDKLIAIDANQKPDMIERAAFTKTAQYQRVLTYYSNSTDCDGGPCHESCLSLAYRNLETDSIEICNSFYIDYLDGTKAMWVYRINSMSGNEFSYQMSWYADDFGGMSGVACVVGGGNRSDEFALRYRQYRPSTLSEPDPMDPYGNLTRTFGPNYADLGAELAPKWQALTDVGREFTLADFPTGAISNPFAIQ